jgi:NTP pyrophosphatase (non-canonical NTP hydrolase)
MAIMQEKTKEALLILQEECAEVVQATSKCFRFGLDGQYQEQSNRDRLEQEIGDVLAMVDILVNQYELSQERLNEAKQRKFKKLAQWSTLDIKGME